MHENAFLSRHVSTERESGAVAWKPLAAEQVHTISDLLNLLTYPFPISPLRPPPIHMLVYNLPFLQPPAPDLDAYPLCPPSSCTLYHKAHNTESLSIVETTHNQQVYFARGHHSNPNKKITQRKHHLSPPRSPHIANQ